MKGKQCNIAGQDEYGHEEAQEKKRQTTLRDSGYCKTYPGADCGSDHFQVICNLRIKLRKLKRPKAAPKF